MTRIDIARTSRQFSAPSPRHPASGIRRRDGASTECPAAVQATARDENGSKTRRSGIGPAPDDTPDWCNRKRRSGCSGNADCGRTAAHINPGQAKANPVFRSRVKQPAVAQRGGVNLVHVVGTLIRKAHAERGAQPAIRVILMLRKLLVQPGVQNQVRLWVSKPSGPSRPHRRICRDRDRFCGALVNTTPRLYAPGRPLISGRASISTAVRPLCCPSSTSSRRGCGWRPRDFAPSRHLLRSASALIYTQAWCPRCERFSCSTSASWLTCRRTAKAAWKSQGDDLIEGLHLVHHPDAPGQTPVVKAAGKGQPAQAGNGLSAPALSWVRSLKLTRGSCTRWW